MTTVLQRSGTKELQKGDSMDAERAIDLLWNIAIYDVVRHGLGAEKREAIKEAIAALEKQTPKEPLPYKGYEGKCSSCGVVFLDRLTKYCGNCGQRLDWSAERSET